MGEYISISKIVTYFLSNTFSCSEIAIKIDFKLSNIILYNYFHHKSKDKKVITKIISRIFLCFIHIQLQVGLWRGLFLSTLSRSEKGTEVTLFISVDQPAGLRLASSDGDERRDCDWNAHCVCFNMSDGFCVLQRALFTSYYTAVGFIQIFKCYPLLLSYFFTWKKLDWFIIIWIINGILNDRNIILFSAV